LVNILGEMVLLTKVLSKIDILLLLLIIETRANNPNLRCLNGEIINERTLQQSSRDHTGRLGQGLAV